MERIKKGFQSITLGITLLLSIYIFYHTATSFYGCYLTSCFSNTVFLTVGSAFLLFSCIIIFNKLLCRFLQSHVRSVVCFCILLIIQLLLIFFCFKNSLPWADSLSVYQEAIDLSFQDIPQISSGGGYFLMYGNNYFFTILLSYIFRFFRFFGLEQYWTIGLFINMISMDLSILFCHEIVRLLYDNERSSFFALFCVFNPIPYIFLPFVYTNTISISFSIAVFYFALLFEKSKNRSVKSLCCVFGAFFLIIGFHIRVTTFIGFIAVVMYAFLSKKFTKQSLMTNKSYLLLFAASCMILALGSSAFVNHHVPAQIKEENFPVTHWIMMGLGEDGMYHYEDAKFTLSFPGKQAKTQANIKEISNRFSTLSSRGIGSVMNWALHKTSFTWASPMDGFYIETGRISVPSSLSPYLWGSKTDFLILYYQAFKTLLWFLCIISLVKQLLFDKNDSFYPYSLCLFGYQIFYILWEANLRYGICLIMLLMLLAFHGLECTSHFCERKEHKYLLLPLLGILLITYDINAFTHFKAFTKTPLSMRTSVISTLGRDYHENEIILSSSSHQNVKQSFQTDQAFNQITFYCYHQKTDDSDTATPFTFRLYDASDSLLFETEFVQHSERKQYYTISFDAICPEKNSTYTFELSLTDDTANDALHLLYFDFAHYDMIPNAVLSIDQISMDRDLLFSVSYDYAAFYTTPHKYQFTVLCTNLLILLLIAGVIFDKKIIFHKFDKNGILSNR